MNKPKAGILFGIIAGIIDVIPMIYQKLSLDACISAFSFWIIAGVIISTSNFKIKGALKGLLVSILILIPTAVLIGWKEPFSLIPILIMTAILGSLLGHILEKYHN